MKLFTKNFLLTTIILGVLLTVISVIFYLPLASTNIASKHQINLENIDTIRADLNSIFSKIASDTNADIVWLNLFHVDSSKLGLITKEDILLTAIHHWIRPNHKIIINLAVNQPIVELPLIDETLLGKCIGRINSVPNPYELSEVPIDRLVLRCPLYDNSGNLIGIYGMSFFHFTESNTEEFIDMQSDVLKMYREEIITALFK